MFAKNYAHYYDAFNLDKPYQKEIDFVYKWAKKPEYIFDIGCGTGSYWRHYPKSVQIFGIEKSRDMRDLAPLHSRISGRIINADITKYKPVTDFTFDCVTALFDVINYIPKHHWWKNLPLKKDSLFIFDIWDKEKIDKEGFKTTVKKYGNLTRVISPLKYNGKKVDLKIEVFNDAMSFEETHRLFIHSRADIERFCGKDFEIVSVKPTRRWQTWYKLRRK